ncbi:ATP-binding protein [Nonomuraea insulae]|uniref:ATP-binding protein n=1 Tax=Nonomuraea insulae TaxID=1616787 RepID=A0ABW1CUL7_9ACTN
MTKRGSECGTVHEGFLAELVLPGIPQSVSVARHCVARVLRQAGHQNVDDVVTVISELVTNAVSYTVSGLSGGLVTIEIGQIGDAIAAVAVIDQGATQAPKMRKSSPATCSGRGLSIVAALSARWGVREDALGGMAVWAEVFTMDVAPPVAALGMPVSAVEA